MGGQAAYKVILVFDVSRWGRFQDTDEAAHYEHVCKSSGIPIHYCAEQFSNEARISDSLLQTLKRFMAGEFSRDLSERAAGGLNNIVSRGFKYGSVPGYGLRRMLVGLITILDSTPLQTGNQGACDLSQALASEEERQPQIAQMRADSIVVEIGGC
jgi:DNA invertase Pin-like site-specific DNA recombinase